MMKAWRVVTALVITGFMVATFLSVLVTASGRVSAVDGVVLVNPSAGDEGAYRYHKMTYQEMQSLRQTIGVRVPDKNYNVIIDGQGTGLAPPTEEEWELMVGSMNVVEPTSNDPIDLTSSFDLSASQSFPKVGNQASQGSCAAWAATYYTYGYMEAADSGWIGAKSGQKNQLFSAAWTYNKVNGGVDRGSWMGTNMNIIIDWGGVTLDTMPYNDKDPVSWGSQAAFREAPLHRGSEVFYISYQGQSTINTVKNLISMGSPVTFAIDAGQYSRGFSDGNRIITASEYSSNSLNHANTFVGYDDGISDDGEVGAFRVVNSWGSGWGDGGYYWLTYEAFKEIGSKGLLFLTYMSDIPGYVPSMLAVWHFDNAPARSAQPQVGIGTFTSPAMSKMPYYEHDNANRFPTFISLDITEFQSVYDGGIQSFFLSVGSAMTSGTISDFKIEIYEGGYTPGAATHVSGQSPGTPKGTPGYITNALPHYSQIPLDDAVDMSGLTFASSSLVRWVGVNHHYSNGGDAIQSGDVGDTWSSDLQTTLTGPMDLWFDWKVSSESGMDSLSFYIDDVLQASISGEVDWQTERSSIGSGVHVLKWEYLKDGTNSRGEDCGWIDNFVVDSAPPMTVATLDGIQGFNGWFVSPVAISLSATDGGGIGVSYTMYRVDGSIWRVYSTPFVVLNEGSNVVEFYSVDLAGNAEAISLMVIDIDTVGPITGLFLNGAMGSNGWYVTKVDVTLTATDGLSGIFRSLYRLDSGVWSIYNGNLQITDDGKHLLEYYSEDLAGNVGAIESTEIKLDMTNPVTEAHLTGTLGENDWHTSDVDVALTFTDVASDVEWTKYRVDSGSWQTYTGPFQISLDGAHVLTFYSKDFSGNTETMRSAFVKIDRVAPSLSVDQSGGAMYDTDTVVVSWTGFDATSGLDRFQTSLDGAPFQSLDVSTSSVSLFDLSEGQHQFTVQAVDAAGHTTERTIDFIVDTLPPVTSPDIGGNPGLHGWFVSVVSLSLNAEDATTGIESTFYRIDGGEWRRYANSFSMSTNGRHTIQFYSTDRIGHEEEVKGVEVMIDFEPPELSILSPAPKVLVSKVVFSWDALDAHSGLKYCEISVDGGDFQRIGELTSFTQHLPDGEHSVVVRAVDVAGNQAETGISFVVDSTVGLGSLMGGVPAYLYAAIVSMFAFLVALLFIAGWRKRPRQPSTGSGRQSEKTVPPPPHTP